jgi:hypothetical protein
MALTIFMLLNGMAVVFMLYALVNFWKEGRRPMNATRQIAMEYLRGDAPDVFVVTHPISHSACGGLSVSSMQFSGLDECYEEDYRRFVEENDEMPLRATRFSTK